MGLPVFGLDFRCVKGEGPKLYNGILYANEGVVLHTYGHGIRQPMAEPQHISFPGLELFHGQRRPPAR